MAKDPAVLFYTADFMIGTAFFTNEQTGKYIRLLCYQHQLGHLSEQQIIDVCGSHDKDIFSKFVKDDEGLFYNIKMEEEKIRRQGFCESRRIARLSGKQRTSNIRETYDSRMETETATETKAVNTTKKDDGVKGKKEKKAVTFVKDNPPTLEEVRAYCFERNNEIDAQAFIDKNTTIGWLDKNKIPYRDWKAVIRTWENYRKVTATLPAPTVSKRPIGIVVIEKIAAGLDNRAILHELVGKYSEHEINEALMQARGAVQ